MAYTEIASSIIGMNANGLLIDLHLHDFLPAPEAIMYYNYISIFAILIWAGFAGNSNESRYAFTIPFFTALLVFIGWLRAYDPTSYWATIVFCMVLGAFMYINDMNHEKYGVAGPGEKLYAIVFFIMCFSVCMGLVSSNEFNFFPSTAMGASQNTMCGTAYACDSAGNIMLDASVTSVSTSGGLMQDVVSAIAAMPAIALGIIKLIVIVAGSVVAFSVVLVAAYPFLAESPATMAFLVAMQFVIWGIYTMAFFRMFSGRVSGGEI
jgi:hypothetical protein